VTKGPRRAKPKSSKRQTKQTKVDRLLALGTMIEAEVDGQRAVFLKMPTPELQDELNTELERKIKQRLKSSGFERLCATRREHPFHSHLLRERIDRLADLGSADHRDYSTEARAEATRQDLLGHVEDTKDDDAYPFTLHDIDALEEKGRKETVRAWAFAIGLYREYLRDPKWHKGTYLERTLNPPDGPPLPNKLPRPVYVSTRNPDLILALANGFVNMWTRR
jgi:hypothetical protein